MNPLRLPGEEQVRRCLQPLPTNCRDVDRRRVAPAPIMMAMLWPPPSALLADSR
jgi:hypothetical protein